MSAPKNTNQLNNILANGTEQQLFSTQFGYPGIWEIFVDLTNMALSDTVIIRQYRSLFNPGGSFRLQKVDTYTNAQAVPIITTGPIANSELMDIKLTLQQTTGTNRHYVYEAIIY